MSRTLALAGALALAAVAFVPAVRAADEPQIADTAQNPPPATALNAFQRFEMKPVAMGAPFTEYKANKVALEHLQANIDLRVNPVLQAWNAQPAGDAPRTLRIEPAVRYIRFITGGKRFWGGAFAGGSSVLMHVRMTDAATGELIADPEFYQHANAMGAAWSFGATDKHMLIRLSAMLEHYLATNHPAAVGGPVAVAPGHEDEDGDAK